MIRTFHRLIYLYKYWRLTPEQRREVDRRIVITTLRAEYAMWGMDVSDKTDEEIEQGVLMLAEMFRSFGVTAEQAETALRQLTRHPKGQPETHPE